MPTLLGYDAQVIPLGSSPEDMRTTIDALLVGYGWQKIFKTIEPLAYVGSISGGAAVSSLFNGNDIPYLAGQYVSSGDAPGIQLSSAVEFTKVQLTRTDGGGAFTAIKIQACDDGATWVDYGVYTGIAGWQALERREFAVTGSPGAKSYWRIYCTTATSGGLAQIRFFDSSGNFTCSKKKSYFIPPSSETIGNTTGRGVLGIIYTDTAIEFVPELEIKVNLPQIITLTNKSAGAGAVTCSATINGATVSITGAGGSSSETNLRLLYEAIRNSANANFTAFNWTWQSPAQQNANDALYCIVGIKVTADGYLTTTASNVDYWNTSGGSCSGIRIGQTAPYTYPITVDLVNGFVLYHQVSNRSVNFASKTNTNYFGPVSAVWADHTKALASMPVTLDPRFLTPIELLVCAPSAQGYPDATAFPSHCWAISSSGNYNVPRFDGQLAYGGHPLYASVIRNVFMDGTPYGHYGSIYQIQIPLRGSALFTGSDSMGNDFQIHSEKMPAVFSQNVNLSVGGYAGEAVVPTLDLGDFYKFFGTATNEALTLVCDVAAATTLNQAMDNTTLYTTLTLTSTTNLASAGYIIIENEVIQYTGKSGVTITGVTRSQWGSPKQSHWAGDSVYQGLWFTVINGGALYAGTTKPV